MNDSKPAHFDRIGAHFLKNIYATAKGRIRLAILQRDLMPLLSAKPLHILDIGGGAGQMAMWYASLGHHVTVIDASQTLLAEGQTLAEQLHLSANLQFLHGDDGGVAQVRSVIYCTEDSIADSDVPQALAQLQTLLAAIPDDCPRNRFIRLRNPAVMQHILQLPHIDKIHGFVLPKIGADNLHDYHALHGTRWQIMPTLESADTFLETAMLRLREALEPWRAQTLCLRIGGNDLLNHLHMRRPRGVTIYDTPIGALINRLVGIFKPAGYHLSAPVFEFLDQPELLAREVREDLRHGLTGKTAIHPEQIAIIEQHYRVPRAEQQLAENILASENAVFNHDNTMQETATHSNWARATLATAKYFPDHERF